MNTHAKPFVSRLGPGRFTYGARYICFLPNQSSHYVTLAECPNGQYDSPEWMDFAEAVCELMNARLT